MSRKNQRRKQQARHETRSYLLAGCQRTFLWVIWLGVVAVLWAHSDDGSLGCTEACVLLAAIASTIGICRNPSGPEKIVFKEPEQLTGGFVSRPSWPWILVSAGITSGGIAFCVRLGHDLYYGFATLSDVFNDIALLFLEWLIERLSNGTSGDVTNTRLYVMVILLPIGLSMLFLNLTPLLDRGQPFRIEAHKVVRVRKGNTWVLLNLDDYQVVSSGGDCIRFHTKDQTTTEVKLPYGRVYSVERRTRVNPLVLTNFFRQLLEAKGFQIEKGLPLFENEKLVWSARRTNVNTSVTSQEKS
jgi:hypothetical protein